LKVTLGRRQEKEKVCEKNIFFQGTFFFSLCPLKGRKEERWKGKQGKESKEGKECKEGRKRKEK
jgi:hypothetical protein